MMLQSLPLGLEEARLLHWASWTAHKDLTTVAVLSAIVEDPRLDVVELAAKALRMPQLCAREALSLLQRQPSVLRELYIGMPVRFSACDQARAYASSSPPATAHAAAAGEASRRSLRLPQSGTGTGTPQQRFDIVLNVHDLAAVQLAAWRRRRAAVFAYSSFR